MEKIRGMKVPGIAICLLAQTLISMSPVQAQQLTNTQLIELGSKAWEARECVQVAKYWFAYLQRVENVSSSLRRNMEKGISWCEGVTVVGAGIKGDQLDEQGTQPPQQPRLKIRRMEHGINRPGRDYRNFNLSVADPQICQDQCDQEQRCRAWTYVKPGVQSGLPRCWLKSAVPPPRESECCVSGQK